MALKFYNIKTWGEVADLIRVEDKDAVRIYALDKDGNRVARFNTAVSGTSSYAVMERLQKILPTADFRNAVSMYGGQIIVAVGSKKKKDAEKKAKLEARIVEISRECVAESLNALPACAESAWNESRNAIEIGIDHAIALTVAAMTD